MVFIETKLRKCIIMLLFCKLWLLGPMTLVLLKFYFLWTKKCPKEMDSLESLLKKKIL